MRKSCALRHSSDTIAPEIKSRKRPSVQTPDTVASSLHLITRRVAVAGLGAKPHDIREAEQRSGATSPAPPNHRSLVADFFASLVIAVGSLSRLHVRERGDSRGSRFK
jgi:hypothetical protein